MTTVVVHKLDHEGEEVWRYEGRQLERTETSLVLEAHFDRQAVLAGTIDLRPGDVFIESFFEDRWYNVFEIYGAEDGQLKGWYVNITRPARIEDRHIYHEDLALDLTVSADHSEVQVLDQDEFEQLDLPARDAGQARRTLTQLLTRAERAEAPFIPFGRGEAADG